MSPPFFKRGSLLDYLFFYDIY